jgi:hypothetical protein
MGDQTLPQSRWWFFLLGLLLPAASILFPRHLDWHPTPNIWLPPVFLFIPCLFGVIVWKWKSERLDLYTSRFIVGFVVGYFLVYWPLLLLLFGLSDFHD